MLKLLLLLAAPAFAQDPPPMQVLVPEFTATSVNDLSVAFTMTEVFNEDLRQLGIQPVPSAAIETRSGARGEACADNPSCPMDLLADWPEVPMVVVASVSRKGDRLDLRVAFYGPGDGRPISELTELIQPGQEFDFTSAVASQANQVLELLYLERGDGPPATWTLPGEETPKDPPGDPVVVVTPKDPPLDPVDPPKDPPKDPVGTNPVGTNPVGTNPVGTNPVGTNPNGEQSPGLTGDPTGSSGRAPGRFLGTGQSAPVTWPTSKPGMKAHAKEMGVSYWAYQQFRESGESDPEIWLRDKRVRSQQLGFEVQTGFISGALDQRMDYRVAMLYESDSYERVDPGGGQDEFFSQVLVNGARRGTLGFGLSVNFNTHVELGFNGGLFQTEQCLTRSFNLKSNTHDLTQTQHLSEQCHGYGADGAGDGQTVLGGYVQPRLRLYPYGLGFVKPYVLGAFTVMVLPGFEMGDQPDTRDQGGGVAWSYGTEQGLLPIGFTGGGGVMFDALYRMGIFVEAQYTVLPFTATLARWEGGDGVSGQADDPATRNLPSWAVEQSDSALPWTEESAVAGMSNLVLAAGLQVRF